MSDLDQDIQDAVSEWWRTFQDGYYRSKKSFLVSDFDEIGSEEAFIQLYDLVMRYSEGEAGVFLEDPSHQITSIAFLFAIIEDENLDIRTDSYYCIDKGNPYIDEDYRYLNVGDFWYGLSGDPSSPYIQKEQIKIVLDQHDREKACRHIASMIRQCGRDVPVALASDIFFWGGDIHKKWATYYRKI